MEGKDRRRDRGRLDYGRGGQRDIPREKLDQMLWALKTEEEAY